MDRFGHLYGHLSLKDIVRFSARTFISLLPDLPQYYGHIWHWFCRDRVIRITRPSRHLSIFKKTSYPKGKRFFCLSEEDGGALERILSRAVAIAISLRNPEAPGS